MRLIPLTVGRENAELTMIASQCFSTGFMTQSETSIGANIHEANYASCKANFINKFHIALKECGETEYWIEMLVGSNSISQQIAKELLQECGIIRRMLVKSITTAKENA